MALNPALKRRIAQAQTGVQKDPIIRDGQYIMIIKEMRIIDASVTGVGDMFAGLLKVEQATAVTQGVEPNPVGSDCATKCNLSTNRAAMSNVKQMIAGALGLADPMAIPEEEWNRILDWVFSDQQPMRGMRIAGSSFRTVIKNGANRGQPFVGINWSQVQQTQQEIAQRRAQLDAADAQKPAPQPQAAPQQFQGGLPPQMGGLPPQMGAYPPGGQPQYPQPQGGYPAQGAAPQPQYQQQAAPQYAQPPQGQQGWPQAPQYAQPPVQPQFNQQQQPQTPQAPAFGQPPLQPWPPRQ